MRALLREAKARVVSSAVPGSSSARLECTVRDREVASSNLAFPTSLPSQP